jgi:hypothetical protein
MKTPKGYLDLAKQYQQPRWEEVKIPTSKEEFYSSVSSNQESKKMTDKQVEELFWDKLVNLGWRKTEIFSDSKGSFTQFVLVCQDCDKAMYSMMSHSMTHEQAQSITNKDFVLEEIAKHKASVKGCQVIPED